VDVHKADKEAVVLTGGTDGAHSYRPPSGSSHGSVHVHVHVLDAKTLKRLDDYRQPRHNYEDLFEPQA
jgi:hypothetical protein